MVIQINTIVSIGQSFGKGLPNVTLQDAKFFGRPNFAGEKNRFKEEKRQFTVLIPNDTADTLREIGYNVKTNIPTPEDLREHPDRETISHLKVAVDDSSDVFIKMGAEGEPTKLDPKTFGVVDKSRIHEMDMEIRAWMYNKDEVAAGEETPKWSARLVTIVVNLERNLLMEKYGNLT